MPEKFGGKFKILHVSTTALPTLQTGYQMGRYVIKVHVRHREGLYTFGVECRKYIVVSSTKCIISRLKLNILAGFSMAIFCCCCWFNRR